MQLCKIYNFKCSYSLCNSHGAAQRLTDIYDTDALIQKLCEALQED